MAACNTVKLVQMVDGQLVASVCDPGRLSTHFGDRGFRKVLGIRQQLTSGGRKYPEEVVGLPIFDDLYGPMYDGEGVARYEDAETERLLSSFQRAPK